MAQRVDHDVVRLDISMNNAMLVKAINSNSDLCQKRPCFILIESLFDHQAFRKVSMRGVLHYEVVVLPFSKREYCFDQKIVIDDRKSIVLVDEILKLVLIALVLEGDPLHCVLHPSLDLLDQIHLAELTLGEQLDDFEIFQTDLVHLVP